MSKDLGTAGDKAPVSYYQPDEAGTPKTGFDSAPKGEISKFDMLHGFGGSNSGAH